MQLPPGEGVRVLDLRAASGLDDLVLSAAERLGARTIMELITSADPTWLLDGLVARGFCATLADPSGATWHVRVGRGPLPALEDLTGLEAPEPLHRVLSALERLAPGAVFLAHLPHRPAPLLPLLDARKASYDVALRPDGTALLWLTAAPR